MKTFLYARCLFAMIALSEAVYSQPKSSIHEKDLARMNEPENLNVFQQWIRWNNGGSLLMNHLTRQAFDLYALRDAEIEKLKDREDWTSRQRTVREKLAKILGPFPEKTPLEPVITGVIKQDGYQIEKLVYQSHPGFYVTACLYLPSRIKGKAPAVVNLIGHEQESFRAELDQVIAVNLVKKGIAVLTIDPLGQGEHVQVFDPKVNFSFAGYSVVEHCYIGNQCFLSGVNSAKYFIWDAIRGIDYLVSRKEIDATRIGVTGFSGGGTITSFVSALDERVKVAIPSSWSTANRRQLETKGAQDAEATLIHSVAMGITFEDLIEIRAPRPTMMTFTSRDEYLTLQGAREAYAESMKAYKAFSAESNLVLVEDDSRHWLTPRIRESIFGFFMRHFGMSGDPKEVPAEILPPEQLKVTKTGQIATSMGGQMVFDLNKKETEELVADLEASRKEIGLHLNKIPARAKELSGYIIPAKPGAPFINGRYQRNGYSVTKFALQGEGEYAIPFLLFVPDQGGVKKPAIVFVHPKGKITEAQTGGQIEKLVRKGYIVAATDVLGIGETTNTASRGLADGYTGVMIGRSVVAIQAADIVKVVNYLKAREDVDQDRIGGMAVGTACIPMMHAAAFDPSISNIILHASLISYRAVVMNRLYKVGLTPREGGGYHHPYEIDFSWGIANVLTGYDLPDLIATIAPRRVVLSGITDEMVNPASTELIDKEMKFPRDAYAFKNASSNIRIVPSSAALDTHLDWAFE
ncbi:MAG TPA: alpha/beta hydrolase family protein [Chryseosolibacter sp.]|nr:alpha/beta hydrolase family protein [Chryseosolibacter sp.]